MCNEKYQLSKLDEFGHNSIEEDGCQVPWGKRTVKLISPTGDILEPEYSGNKDEEVKEGWGNPGYGE